MTAYAKDTEVSVEKSQAEISAIVRRYGATGFMTGWEGDRAMVASTASDRRVRFVLTLPSPKERRFLDHSRGRRTPEAATAAWEQACRQKWRALALAIKAKLEAVSAGIAAFEEEFLAHIVLPDGSAFYEHAAKAVGLAYSTGELPKVLPPPAER